MEELLSTFVRSIFVDNIIFKHIVDRQRTCQNERHSHT